MSVGSAGAVAGLKCTEAVAVRRFDEERIMGTNLRAAHRPTDFTHNRQSAADRTARLCTLLHKPISRILNAITSNQAHSPVL